MATPTIVHKNPRVTHNFRVSISFPIAFLTAIGFNLEVANQLDLLVTEVEEPAMITDVITYPTGNGSANVAGITKIDDRLTLKTMEVDPRLLDTPLGNAIAKFTLNKFFYLWQLFCSAPSSFSPLNVITAAALLAKFSSSAQLPKPMDIVFGPGSGNLPDAYKGYIVISQLTPNQGQPVQAMAYDGVFPVSSKPESRNRSSSALVLNTVEFAIDGAPMVMTIG